MKISFLLVLLIPVFALAQNDTGKITISGFFTDLPDSVKIIFSHPSSSAPVAETFSKGKKFTLSATLPYAGLSHIALTGKNVSAGYDLFTGAEKVTITGTIKNIKKAKVTGAAYQLHFLDFVKAFEPSFKKLNDINKKLTDEASPEKRTVYINTFNEIKQGVEKKIDSFIAVKPVSPVSSFLLYVTKDLYSDNPLATYGRIQKLTGVAQRSVYAEALKKEVESALVGAVGTEAADFSQPDTAGVAVKLSSFRGKYVLLDFWASWCGPCRNENPTVVASYEKFKNKNFTILGVSLDRPGFKDAWLQAIKDDRLSWTHVSDLKFWQNEAAQLYKVGSIPQNFLIDPKGKIIAKNLRGAALDEKLCEVLGCN